MSDDWEPEDLELEAAMLALKPGEFRELHGAVVVCGKDGTRERLAASSMRSSPTMFQSVVSRTWRA